MIDISRSKLNSYERGVQPNFKTQILLADIFKISLDALIRYDLSILSEFQLHQIRKGQDIDITGQKLRLLTISVDSNEDENIIMVHHKAQAGYTSGYADPDYIKEMPKFKLPFLPDGKTYRSFQISGESMLPIPSGSWITASYIQNWTHIKAGLSCIVVTKNDGIIFKRLYIKDSEPIQFTCVSTNPSFEPYSIALSEIIEIWQFETYNAFNF